MNELVNRSATHEENTKLLTSMINSLNENRDLIAKLLVEVSALRLLLSDYPRAPNHLVSSSENDVKEKDLDSQKKIKSNELRRKDDCFDKDPDDEKVRFWQPGDPISLISQIGLFMDVYKLGDIWQMRVHQKDKFHDLIKEKPITRDEYMYALGVCEDRGGHKPIGLFLGVISNGRQSKKKPYVRPDTPPKLWSEDDFYKGEEG